jgi:hypothetical protein
MPLTANLYVRVHGLNAETAHPPKLEDFRAVTSP